MDTLHAKEMDPLADVDERLIELRKAIASLPEKYRTVIERLKIEGYSVKEVAKELGISESAVKVRSHRAFHKLSDQLKSIPMGDSHE